MQQRNADRLELPRAVAAEQIEAEFGFGKAELPRAIKRLLAYGPESVGDHDKGMAFWTRIWDLIRLEERLRAIDHCRVVCTPEELEAALARRLEELSLAWTTSSS